MRKPGAALVAAPARLIATVATLDPRGRATRLLAVAAAAAFAASFLVGMRPPAGVAVPASEPEPVSATAFAPIGTAHGLKTPFMVGFDAPMDAASVAGALQLTPTSAYTITWDATGRTMTVSPVDHWRPDTLYSVVVGRTAKSTDGGTLAAAVRTVALTARGGSGAMAVGAPNEGSAQAAASGPAAADTAAADDRALADDPDAAPDAAPARLPVGLADPALTRIRLDSTFLIHLDRPVPPARVRAALRSEPAIAGDLVAGAAPGTFVLRPSDPLAPDTDYRVWLTDLVDAVGVPFESLPVVQVRTVPLPKVVRFRPADDATRVKRAADLSVRFSEPMDREPTEAAFRATADGKRVKGTITWAEDDTVLVFDPAKSLPYGTKVVLRVDGSARSAVGAPLAGEVRATFRTVPRPDPASVPIPTGSGGAVSGSWVAVEKYYLRLMNCTRTGGWVTASGSCSSPGGRDVAPLALSSGISSRVARPYARLLATRGLCTHFVGGNPGDRLRAAGYTSYRWAENIGCRGGNPYGSVLATHLFYQSEKPWNGGHYRNLMDARFTQVGIGVWVSGSRVRLVVDFYRP